MKILFYIDTMEHEGGAQRVMSIIANGLCNYGHEVSILCDFYTKSQEYKIDNKIKRYYLAENNNGNKIIKNIYRIKKLRFFLKHLNPDISISFLANHNIRLLFASLYLKKRIILSVRNDPKAEFGNKGVKRKFISYLYSKADGIVYQTKAELDYFKNLKNLETSIILNPLDDIFYRIKRNEKLQNIISFGRLESQKNQKLMIEAFNQIHNCFPNEKLYIYGEGYLREELQNYINEQGLSNSVFLPGRIENVGEKLSSAKLFVLSSNYEGLPNAVMESMAVGVPVISTDCSGGGARMLIEDGVNGRLVECNNVEQMAETIKECLQNEELLKIFSENGKKKAEEFRNEKIVIAWNDFINKVLE